MDKLYLISIVVLFLFGNSCFAQTAVPCVDLFDGVPTNGQGFSDPTYFNGQSFGYYNKSVVDVANNNIKNLEFSFQGISWWWDSRSEGTATPIFAPVLRHKFPSEISYSFSSYFAAGINGELFRDAGSLTRTCGNETLTAGPGYIRPQEDGSWKFFNVDLYNITFWQQLYIPSGPLSNWARVVHFLKTDRDVEINYFTYSDYTWSLKTLFVHEQSVANRYNIYTDLDQQTFLRMPTAINFMGKNGRIAVAGANSMDCYSLITSSEVFNLKAGQTVAFAYFVNLGFEVNQAVSTAQWIDSQPAESFAKLSNDELSQIMNWDACAAVLGSQVSVKVDQTDKCTKSPTLQISLTTSLSYSATHRVLRSDGSVVQSVSDSSFTMSESGTFTLETTMNNCVVKRTRFDVVVNDASFNSDSQTISGSNEPFTFNFDSKTKTLTATDAYGCKTEAVLGTVVSGSSSTCVNTLMTILFVVLTIII